MRKAVLILATIVLAAAPVTAGASTASAKPDKRPCVTRGEVGKIRYGDSHRRVHRVFDTKGKKIFTRMDGDDRVTLRQYRPCQPWTRKSGVSLLYVNGQVDDAEINFEK